MKTTHLGSGWLLLAAILYSLIPVFVRPLSEFMSVLHQVSYRGMIGFSVLLVILVLTRHARGLIGTRKTRLVRFFSLLANPLSILTLTLAYLHTSVVLSLFALYLGVVSASIVLSVAWFGERFTKDKQVASLLLVIALICISGVTPATIPDALNIGFWYGFVSGVLMTCANSMIKKINSQSIFDVPALHALGAFLGATVGIAFIGDDVVLVLPPDVWLLATLYTAATVGGAVAIAYGFKKGCDFQIGSILLATQLGWGPIIGYFWFNEIPGVLQLIGCFIMLMAAAVAKPPALLQKKLPWLFEEKPFVPMAVPVMSTETTTNYKGVARKK